MNIQHLTFSVIFLAAYVTVATADETADKESHNTQTALMSDTTHTSGHGAASKDQPFWSKEQSRQAELEQAFKDKIAENAEDKQAYASLAGLYLTNNKTAKAIDAYQDAITHNPENPKLFAAISIAYLHQSKYAMSKAMADEALRLDPSMTQVKKINEYIDAKEKAIQAASNVSLKEARESGANLGPIPDDAMHGSKDPTLLIDNPAGWAESRN